MAFNFFQTKTLIVFKQPIEEENLAPKLIIGDGGKLKIRLSEKFIEETKKEKEGLGRILSYRLKRYPVIVVGETLFTMSYSITNVWPVYAPVPCQTALTVVSIGYMYPWNCGGTGGASGYTPKVPLKVIFPSNVPSANTI